MFKSKSSLNDLKIQYDQLKATQREYLKEISKKEKEILNKNLESENNSEKIKTLSQEYQIKLQIHEEQLQKIEEKQRERKENKNIINEVELEKQNKEEMTNKLNQLVETFVDLESSKVVDELVQEYKIITKNFNNIIEENQKLSDGDKISSVQIKHLGKSLSFRIIDDYYTFSDLFSEACRLLELDNRNHKISLSNGENINLATGVKEHIQRMKIKYKSVPHVDLISTSEDLEINLNQFMKQVKEESDITLEQNSGKKDLLVNLKNKLSKTGNLLTREIRMIEINLLGKLKVIIFYLVFLFIVYISNMSRNKIHQKYFVNNAFESQVYSKPYLDPSRQGLDNNFSTIKSFKDLKFWCFEMIQQIFNYQDVVYDLEMGPPGISNKTFTSFMENFVVIGGIRILVTRQSTAVNSTNFTYPYSSSSLSSVFQNYESFRSLSTLDTARTYSGFINTYTIDRAYAVNVPPTSREMLLILSMMDNLNMFNSDMELFVMSYNGYNYNQDIFISVSLYFEQNSFGMNSVNYSTCSLDFLDVIYAFASFKLSSNLFGLISTFIITVYSFYGVYGIIRDIKNEKLDFFRRGQNWIFLFKIILYVLCIVLRSKLYLIVGNNLKWVNETTFIDTSDFCNQYEILNILEMLMICITLIYILTYLDRSIVGIINDTLLLSWRIIFVFIVSYAFSLLGYAAFCNYVYGVSIPEFRSLKTSIFQIFLMVFGDFSILVKMNSVLSSITLLFTCFFALTFFLLFLNWLIGTIIHYYNIKNLENAVMKQTTGTGSPEGTNMLKIVGGKMIRSVLLRVIDIFSAIKASKLKRLLQKEEKEKKKKAIKEKKENNEISKEIRPSEESHEDPENIESMEEIENEENEENDDAINDEFDQNEGDKKLGEQK